MERLFGKPNAPSQRASVEAADEAMPARLVQVLEKASATDTEAAPHADDAKPQASTLQARQEPLRQATLLQRLLACCPTKALQKREAKKQAHQEAVQKLEAVLTTIGTTPIVQAKPEAAYKHETTLSPAEQLEAMFSPDEQAVLRKMTEEEAELLVLEASMGQVAATKRDEPPTAIDWRGVQVSEVALELLLKAGWLERGEESERESNWRGER